MGRDYQPVKLLGTSQQNLKVNSSIALDVTENHQVPGRYQTIHEVRQQCEDSAGVSNCPDRQLQTCNLRNHCLKSLNSAEHILEETKNTPNILCEFQKNSFGISNEISAEIEHVKQANDTSDLQDFSKANIQKKKSKLDVSVNTAADNEFDTKLCQERTLDVGTQACTDKSCQCTPPLSEIRRKNRSSRHNTECNHNETPSLEDDSNGHKRRKRKVHRHKYHEQEIAIERKHTKRKVNQQPRRMKDDPPQLDQRFIEYIIRKQYTPKEIFGRRESELSHISAPVCRDRDSSLSESTTKVCLCGYEPHSLPPAHSQNYKSHNKSHNACDTRFISSRRARSRSRYLYVDPYNDMDLYDMIPVKETSYHISRRKPTYVDNSSGCDVYREVPPSPRTHLPRLNLEAQVHTNYENFLNLEPLNEMNTSKHRHQKRQDYESETTSVTMQRETAFSNPVKVQTSMNLYQQSCPLSNRLECSPVANIPEPSTLGTNNVHTVDKSLSELKDILQSFLDEIKKKSVEGDKSMDNTKKEQSREVFRSNSDNTNCAPMSDARVEAKITMNAPHPFMPDKSTSPFVPGITSRNPLSNKTEAMPSMAGLLSQPISDMTCPQNSMPPQNTCSFKKEPHCTMHYLPPTLSRACCYSSIPICPRACSAFHCCHLHHFSLNDCQHCSIKKESNTERNTETEELIKEIYNIVTLNPVQRDRDNAQQKMNLTSRSVGINSNGVERGITQLRSYSKSCEAIASPKVTQGSYATRSDTLLDKLHLDMSQSDAKCSEIFRKREDQSKKKKTIKNFIKSLFRKITTVGAETTPESYYVQVDNEPPFPQEVIDYMMIGQKYLQRSSRRPQRTQFCECCNNDSNNKHPSQFASRVNHPPQFYPETSSSSCNPQELHRQTTPEHEPTYGPKGFFEPKFGPKGFYEATYGPKASYEPTYGPRASYEPTYGPQGYSCHGLPSYLYPPKQTLYNDFEVPLCLREIEVKSTGTQSEKKVSFLNKLGRKVRHVSQPKVDPRTKMETQKSNKPTQQSRSRQFKKPKSSWQKFQENIQKDMNDQMAFGFKHRDKMGDNKNLRKKLLKKMFHKNNPFSPSNLIINSLLGND